MSAPPGKGDEDDVDLDVLWEAVAEGDRATIEALLVGVRAPPGQATLQAAPVPPPAMCTLRTMCADPPYAGRGAPTARVRG